MPFSISQFLNQGAVLDLPALATITVDNNAAGSIVGNLNLGAAGTIAASGTLTSAVIPTAGLMHFALGATLSNAGTISVQRYLDGGGVVPTGAAITQALTAATAGVLDNLGTVVSQSLKVSFINSGTTAATLTAVAMALASK